MNRPNNMSHLAVRFDVTTWLNLMDAVATANFIKDELHRLDNAPKPLSDSEKKCKEYLQSRKQIFEAFIPVHFKYYSDKPIKVQDILRGIVNKGTNAWNIENNASLYVKAFVRAHRIYNHFDVDKEKKNQTENGTIYLSIKKDFTIDKWRHNQLKELCKEIDCPISVYVRRLTKLLINNLDLRNALKKHEIEARLELYKQNPYGIFNEATYTYLPQDEFETEE